MLLYKLIYVKTKLIGDVKYPFTYRRDWIPLRYLKHRSMAYILYSSYLTYVSRIRNMVIGYIRDVDEHIYDLHEIEKEQEREEFEHRLYSNSEYKPSTTIENATYDILSILECYDGNLGQLSYYLEYKGVNIHIFGDELLKYAVIYGHFHIVKYLIEHGANVYSYGGILLRLTAEGGSLDILRYLVETTGISIFSPLGEYVLWEHLIVIATGKNYLDMVKYLLSISCIDIQNIDTNVLLAIITSKQPEMVACFIEHTGGTKGIAGISDELKFKILHLGLCCGKIGVVKYLVEVICLDLGMKDNCGYRVTFGIGSTVKLKVFKYLAEDKGIIGKDDMKKILEDAIRYRNVKVKEYICEKYGVMLNMDSGVSV